MTTFAAGERALDDWEAQRAMWEARELAEQAFRNWEICPPVHLEEWLELRKLWFEAKAARDATRLEFDLLMDSRTTKGSTVPPGASQGP